MQNAECKMQKSERRAACRFPVRALILCRKGHVGCRSGLLLLTFAFCILHSAFSASVAPTPPASPDAPDIRTIVPPQPYFLSGSLLWLVVAAVSLLLAGLVAWYLLRRPKAPKPSGPRLTPRETAQQKLAALEREMDNMDARRFGAEVCDVLRFYIGDEYRMHPQRQTSPEFLASVAASRVFSRNEHTLLGEFLEGCDLLKFARLDATPAGKRALLTQAREFIDGREREEPPPMPPSSPPPLPSQPLLPPPLPTAENAGANNR